MTRTPRLVMIALVATSALGLRSLGDGRAVEARAQQRGQMLGTGACIGCHTHAPEREWYDTKEMVDVASRFPDRGRQAGHKNSMNQLDEPNARKYGAAIGQQDVYALAGKCVTCHAAVFKGDTQGGVTCEHCHGLASGYVELHQRPNSYDASIAVGMIDVRKGPQVWARQCYGCHVVKDAKLTAAGHPSGADFDLGRKFLPVSLHFKKRPAASEVAAAWTQLRAADAAPPPQPQPQPQPPSPPPQPPAEVRRDPPPVTTKTEPPVGPRSSTPSVAVARGGDLVAPPRTAPTPPPPAPDPPPAASPTPPPVTVSPPIARPSEPAAGGTEPTSPSGALAAVQGRLIVALTELLQQGAKVPARSQTRLRVVPYAGPDAALLQLQAEAIALALDVLGRAPAPGKR